MNLLRLKVHSIQYVEAQYSLNTSSVYFKGRNKYIKKFNHYKSQGFRWLYDYLRIRRAYLKEKNLKTGSIQTLIFNSRFPTPMRKLQVETVRLYFRENRVGIF